MINMAKNNQIKIKVDLSSSIKDNSYNIYIGSNILSEQVLPENEDRFQKIIFKSVGIKERICIITSKTVNELHGANFENLLKETGFEPAIICLPDGEATKSIKYLTFLYDELIKNNIERSDCIIAFGGGVIGDIAGFAAATYLRGINFIQIPTTLLADVDSSVGGKTGIDHPSGKNLIGAFYQPKSVIIDVNFLDSLDDREFKNGFAEVIKYGCILDEDLFSYLEQNYDKILSRDKQSLIHIIERSCAIKADVVNKDEKESGFRSVLNFGHSLGHAIETLYNYENLKHGEAISIGMVFAAMLSKELGFCGDSTVERIKKLIKNSNLPAKLPGFTAEEFINAMKKDKKVQDKKIKFVLTGKIGYAILKIIDFDVIYNFLKKVLKN
jgi:3-dehydroquinate synthase